jgi:hypothetical protein
MSKVGVFARQTALPRVSGEYPQPSRTGENDGSLGHGLDRSKAARPANFGERAKLLFNPQQLVVFGDAVVREAEPGP